MNRPMMMPPRYDERRMPGGEKRLNAPWKRVSEQIKSGFNPKVFGMPRRGEDPCIGQLVEAYEADGVYYLKTDTGVLYSTENERAPFLIRVEEV